MDCGELRALLRSEIDVLRRDQTEAFTRSEDRLQKLLSAHERRLPLLLRAASHSRPTVSAGELPAATAMEATSPCAHLKTPSRRSGRRSCQQDSPCSAWRSSTASLSPMQSRSPKGVMQLPIMTRGPAYYASEEQTRTPGCGSQSMDWDLDTRQGAERDLEGQNSPGRSPSMVPTVTNKTSGSPAATSEWKHHMRRRITNKISKREEGSVSWVASQFMGSQVGRRLSVLRSERASWVVESFRQYSRPSNPARSKTCAEVVVDSSAFEVFCGVIIVATAVTVGLQQDSCIRSLLGEVRMEDGQSPTALPLFDRTSPLNCEEGGFQKASAFFHAAFLAELCFRIFAKRCTFFCGQDWKSNLCDIVLAIYCSVEWIVYKDYTPFFLVFRLLRLGRVLRAVRSVRMFRDLRLMICSLSQSLVSLCSAFVLLFVVIFLFSICFTYGFQSYIVGPGVYKIENLSFLQASYGSLPQTMYTLLLAISNGADWQTLASPLRAIDWKYEWLFIFYVMFVVVGVLNVLTSSFVERARELSSLDRDLATQAELASQEAFLAEMRRIFEQVDDAKEGRITWQKFRDYLTSERASAFFATQQLDTSDAARLFSLLEADEMGAVAIEDFTLGCLRLRGPAKSSDVAALLKDSKVNRKYAKELRRISGRLDGLCSFLQVPEVAISRRDLLTNQQAPASASSGSEWRSQDAEVRA